MKKFSRQDKVILKEDVEWNKLLLKGMIGVVVTQGLASEIDADYDYWDNEFIDDEHYIVIVFDGLARLFYFHKESAELYLLNFND